MSFIVTTKIRYSSCLGLVCARRALIGSDVADESADVNLTIAISVIEGYIKRLAAEAAQMKSPQFDIQWQDAAGSFICIL